MASSTRVTPIAMSQRQSSVWRTVQTAKAIVRVRMFALMIASWGKSLHLRIECEQLTQFAWRIFADRWFSKIQAADALAIRVRPAANAQLPCPRVVRPAPKFRERGWKCLRELWRNVVSSRRTISGNWGARHRGFCARGTRNLFLAWARTGCRFERYGTRSDRSGVNR
jgi:hypothetical protein